MPGGACTAVVIWTGHTINQGTFAVPGANSCSRSMWPVQLPVYINPSKVLTHGKHCYKVWQQVSGCGRLQVGWSVTGPWSRLVLSYAGLLLGWRDTTRNAHGMLSSG
jgi:hypothetical protein